MDITEIAKKIIEEQDIAMSKAFAMHIGKLLMENGIRPIVKKIEKEPYEYEDKNVFIINKGFGVTFEEIDCTEHDKKVREQAIDEYRDRLYEAFDKTDAKDRGMYPNNIVRTVAAKLKAE